MNKEKIITNLKKYNYNFVDNNNVIIISLDLSHQVIIDISDDNRIIIKDKLVHWNFLSGGIPMNLKSALILWFACAMLFLVVCIYPSSNPSEIYLTNFFIAYAIWVLLFSSFYTIKLESFKQQLVYWTSVA